MEKINESNQSIYCYEGTSVLINNRNIMDKKMLEKIEIMITTYKLIKIINDETDFKRDLSVDHYLNIHKYLFEDIYPFAGRIRKEFTNKKNSSEISNETGVRIFCKPDFIYDCLKEKIQNMKNEAINIKNKDDILDFLTKYYLDLYYIHPFREGNSRTLREFMREYVEMMNKFLFDFGDYEIKYSCLNDDDNRKFILSVIWNTSADKNKQEKSSVFYALFSKKLTKSV